MKVLVRDIKGLLSDKLSMEERGVLITLLLLKEDNPRIMLVKLKEEIKSNSNYERYKIILGNLHRLGWIEWSGYNSFVKMLEKKKSNPKVVEVISFMNILYGRNFNPESENTIKELRNRLDEESIEDVKLVVSNRYIEWKDDTEMKKHLNPGTIFRKSKFEKYLEYAQSTKIGESIVKIDELGLKEGDDFTYDMRKKLVPREVYLIKYFGLDDKGKKLGGGITEQITGKELRRQLNMQNNKAKRGSADFVYTYLSK